MTAFYIRLFPAFNPKSTIDFVMPVPFYSGSGGTTRKSDCLEIEAYYPTLLINNFEFHLTYSKFVVVLL